MDRQPLTDRLGDRLLAEYGGAAAAYSLRALNGNGDSVVRVRRASDNDEKDFTALQVSSGELTNWVNSQIVPPLDIGVETSEGRIPVPEGGTSIGTPAAAYSLRNLSTTYTGNVVDVRRSSDNAEESFTAEEVSDGTLEAWVDTEYTFYTSDFSANLDGWITSSSILTPNIDQNADGSGQPPSDNWLRISAGDRLSLANNKISVENIIKALGGGTYEVEVDYYAPETVGNHKIIAFTDNAGNVASAGLTFHQGSGSRTYSLVLSEVAATSLNSFRIGSTNTYPTGTLLYLKNIRIRKVDADGFVTKWYDQSGNDNHATQGTAASQPKIVDGGSLVDGGIDFDGVDDVLITSLVPPNVATLIGVANWDIEDQSTMIIGARDSVNQRSYLAQTSSGQSAIGVSSSALPDVDIVAGDDYLLFGVHSGLTRLLSTNGSVISDSGGSAPNNTIHGYSVGALNTVGTNGSFMDGTLAEVIVYPSDQSNNRTAIEANIGETYGITGIPAYDNTVDGFVETWYDQSGNGNDATQSVAASQPKIVDAGVFLGEVDFLDGVNTFLETTNSALCNVDELSVFSVLKPFIAQSQAVAFSCGSVVLNSSAYGGWRLNFNGYLNKAEFQTQAVGNSSGSTVSNDVGGSYTLLSYVADFPDASTFANGQAGLTSTNNISPNNPDSLRRRFRIGCQYTFTRAGFYPEPIKEIILYTSDQSSNRVAIETNINAHYNIYP
jgi:hypothetical protein